MALATPLRATLEQDGEGYLARCLDIPETYGYAEDMGEALEALKEDLLTLYQDLMADDNFTPKWLKYKAMLKVLLRGS